MPTTDYTIISQVHQPQYIAGQGAVEGWVVTARDSVTGTIVPVFIADTYYTVDNVKAAIEHALGPIRAVAQLGRAATTTG